MLSELLYRQSLSLCAAKADAPPSLPAPAARPTGPLGALLDPPSHCGGQRKRRPLRRAAGGLGAAGAAGAAARRPALARPTHHVSSSPAQHRAARWEHMAWLHAGISCNRRAKSNAGAPCRAASCPAAATALLPPTLAPSSLSSGHPLAAAAAHGLFLLLPMLPAHAAHALHAAGTTSGTAGPLMRPGRQATPGCCRC